MVFGGFADSQWPTQLTGESPSSSVSNWCLPSPVEPVSETYKACPKWSNDAAQAGSFSLKGVVYKGWQQTRSRVAMTRGLKGKTDGRKCYTREP